MKNTSFLEQKAKTVDLNADLIIRQKKFDKKWLNSWKPSLPTQT